MALTVTHDIGIRRSKQQRVVQGRKVELRNQASLGRPVHQVLMQVANDTNADLILLCGYRHSRLQQTIFGGVTRNMLRDTRLPLLVSH